MFKRKVIISLELLPVLCGCVDRPIVIKCLIPFSSEKVLTYVFENYILNNQEEYPNFYKTEDDYCLTKIYDYLCKDENVEFSVTNSYFHNKMFGYFTYKNETNYFEIKTTLSCYGQARKDDDIKTVTKVELEWVCCSSDLKEYYNGNDYADFVDSFYKNVSSSIYRNGYVLFENILFSNIMDLDFEQFLDD